MTRHPSRTMHPWALARSLTRVAVAAATTSVVALGASAQTPAPAGPAAAQPATAATLVMTGSGSLSSDTYERRVQRQVNIRRANHGLRKLRFADCPDGTAERWSRYLAANDAFFHQSMTSVLDKCSAQYAGETLGRGSMTPHKLVRMWMESPAHRDILLSKKSRRLGVGASRDDFGRWVVAANFIRF